MNGRLKYNSCVMRGCRRVVDICKETGVVGIIIIIEEKLRLL